MKKLFIYIFGIITALGITAYAGFEVFGINDIIMQWRLIFQWSGLMWNDIQNLQMWDTDTAWDKPTLTNISGSTIKTRCFDGAGGGSTRMMYGNVEIPHDMYTWTGAVLSPHIHWMGTTTSATTTGIWFLDYSIRKVNWLYTSTTTITWENYGITWRQARISEIDGDIPATGLSIGDTISFRIWRNSSLSTDTYQWDLCLTQVGFHYQIDTLGSRGEYLK